MRTKQDQAGKLVLVVDDDSAVRALAREHLEASGFVVEEAENGAAALERLANMVPDMILMDVVMPGVDGFTACQRIRVIPEFEGTPVLIMTELDDYESIEMAFLAGATGFASKPVNWTLEVHRIRYMIRANAAMRRLKESEARNRALLGAIPDLMFRFSGEGVLLEKRITAGHEGPAVIDASVGTHLYQAVPPEVAFVIEHNMDAALRGKRTEVFEFKFGHEDDRRTYQGRIRVVAENEVLLLIQDITARKEIEEQAFLAKTEWERTFDSIDDIVCILDQNYCITRANLAAVHAGHMSGDKIVGRQCFELFQGLSEPCEGCPVKESVADGNPHHQEIYYSPIGRICMVSASPIRDGNGAIKGYVHIARDISEQKKLEEEYLHAQKMEAVGTLAGGIAHDFNNLLAAILGNAELMVVDSESNPEARESIDQVVKAARRGRSLTSQLLTMSRKMESRCKPMQLNAQVEETEQLLRRTLPKMIDIKLSLDPDLHPVNADRGQMEQILMNLAVNASYAMDENGCLSICTRNITLDADYCHAHAGALPGSYTLLEVSDDGSGIDEELRDRIFEPFFTTKEIGEGTGLGLAVIYGIVKAHNGYIMCYSEQGVGTTFKIYLPVALDILDEPIPQEPVEEAGGGLETILVIDDEAPIRRLAERMLTRSGYAVVTAVDGPSGIEKYSTMSDSIDLVILDLFMPGMDGREALTKIRGMNPEARVLIASGYAMDSVKKEVLHRGARAFLNKPYDRTELLRSIRNALDDAVFS